MSKTGNGASAPAKPAKDPRFKELPEETQKLVAETAVAALRGLDRSADNWTNRVLTYLVLVNSGALLLVLNQASDLVEKGYHVSQILVTAGFFTAGLVAAGIAAGWAWNQILRRLRRVQETNREFFRGSLTIDEFTSSEKMPRGPAKPVRVFFALSFLLFLGGVASGLSGLVAFDETRSPIPVAPSEVSVKTEPPS